MAQDQGGRLAGKVALVVGAGSSGPGWGNGKATAVLFARQGARVLCLDRSAEAARQTADLIAGEGGSGWALTGDVTDPDSMARAIAEGERAAGPIDVLHYNVGITRLGGAIDQSPDDWHAVIDINLNGLFNTVRLVVPGMIERGRGAVVAVSSITGIRWTGVPYVSYAASKAAVIQFIRHLALEHAKTGVRANTILPGLMRTPMVEGQLAAHYGDDVEKMMAARDAACPTGRMGDAWDVAHAALFLASDEAGYITGTELVVDGGISAGIVGG